MENQTIRVRIPELLKEIEIIRAKNEHDHPTRTGVGRVRFENRWARLEEIKQEIRELSTKMRSQIERDDPKRNSR
jgi:cellulose biosynthesis protein BcsQ